MRPLTFTVPWTFLVSDNRKYVSGSFVLTPEYRRAKEGILLHALKAAKAAKWPKQTGPLALDVVITEPDRRKRDLNFDKALSDGIEACEAVLWDDSQFRVKHYRFTPGPDKANAGAVVTIRVLNADYQEEAA